MRLFLITGLLLVLAGIAACKPSADETPQATVTASPTATTQPTQTTDSGPSPTNTVGPVATVAPAPTSQPTSTPEPSAPSLTLTVTVPSNTPVEDTVFFHSGPFVALPMHRAGQNSWELTLTEDDLMDPNGNDGADYRGASYDRGTGAVEYAYTRGMGYLGAEAIADDPGEGGFWARMRTATLLPGGGKQADEVSRWRWFPGDSDPLPEYVSSAGEWAERESEFQAGFMFADLWDDDVAAVTGSTDASVIALNGAWAEVAPPWDYSQVFPTPLLAPDRDLVPAYTDEDLTAHLAQIKADGLKVLLAPQLCCTEIGGLDGRDAAWLDEWFVQYENYLVTHAQIAEQVGVDAFLVDFNLAKALGPETESTYDYASKFRAVIVKVREAYSGPVGISSLASMSYGEFAPPWPWHILGQFADLFDFAGVSIWQGFADNNDASADEIETSVADFFQSVIDQFHADTGLDIVITSAAYGSFDGGARNDPDVFSIANAIYFPETELAVEIDLLEQAMVFDSLLSAVASRPFITGFYPFLYQYVALPLSPDYSVRGKPAEQVIADWYRVAINR